MKFFNTLNSVTTLLAGNGFRNGNPGTADIALEPFDSLIWTFNPSFIITLKTVK
jgi:hypothetical protein